MIARIAFEEAIFRAKFSFYRGRLQLFGDSIGYEVSGSSAITSELMADIVSEIGDFGIDLFALELGVTAADLEHNTDSGIKHLSDYINDARSFAVELEGATPSKLHELWKDIQQKRAEARIEAGEANDRFAWFNRPECDADFEFWRKHVAFTADEATALSLGKEPTKVNEESLGALSSVAPSNFKAEYGRRLKHLQRYLALEDDKSLISPQDLNKCAIKIGVNTIFIRLLTNTASLRTSDEGIEAINPKRLKSIYKMIVLMAVDKYELKLDGNSHAPGKISKVFEHNPALSINRDTVRDILRSIIDDETMSEFIDELRRELKPKP